MGGGESKTSVKQTSTSALDVETQKSLVSIAERQQELAEDQYAQFLEVFKPFEIDIVNANRELIPINKDLVSAQFKAQLELLPERTKAARLGLEEAQRDIELGRPIKEALQQRQLTELEQTAPIVSQFLKEAGVSGKALGARFAEEGAANVAQQFGLAREQLGRELGRFGINQKDPRFSAALARLTVAEAKARAGASTRGLRLGEDVAFQRQGQGAQFAGRATGLPGVGSLQGVAPGALPFQTGAIQLGGIGDPAARALAGFGAAAGTFESAGTRTDTMTKTTTKPTAGAGAGLAKLAGGMLGSFLGPLGSAAGSALAGHLAGGGK